MSRSVDRIVIGIVAAVTLCCVPLLLRFERTHEGWSDTNAEAIATMSSNERDDLIANAKRFGEYLTPEKRSVVEAIHTAVADPETEQRFNAYHDWLQGLNVVERDSIRSAESTEDKVTLVQLLIADAEQQAEGFTISADDWRIRRFRGEEFGDKLKEDFKAAGLDTVRVSDREYDAMIDVMAEYLPDDAKTEFEKGLKELRPDAPEEERYRLRSNALGTAMWNWLRKRRKPPEPNPEAIDQILNQIEDSQAREGLKNLDTEQKRLLVGIMQFRSMDQFRFIAPYLPTDAEVAEFYSEKLDRADQISHMQMFPTESRRRLNLMYLARNEPETIPADIQDMAKSMLQRLDRMAREPDRRGSRGGRSHRDRGDRGGRGGRRGPSRPRDEDENREKRRPPTGGESPPPKPAPGEPPGPPPNRKL